MKSGHKINTQRKTNETFKKIRMFKCKNVWTYINSEQPAVRILGKLL